VRYSADITAGSLKVQESRVIADLLLRGVDTQHWKDTIEKQNLLQVRNPATAKRLARLIRKRLELMDDDLWQLVRDGIGTVKSLRCKRCPKSEKYGLRVEKADDHDDNKMVAYLFLNEHWIQTRSHSRMHHDQQPHNNPVPRNGSMVFRKRR
jgi:hypothetical protein